MRLLFQIAYAASMVVGAFCGAVISLTILNRVVLADSTLSDDEALIRSAIFIVVVSVPAFFISRRPRLRK